MGADAGPVDPGSLIRSGQYRRLLVLAALIGLLVSTAAWCFLEAVHQIEVWVYDDLPHHLGYDTAPGTSSSDLLKLVRYGRTQPLADVGDGGDAG